MKAILIRLQDDGKQTLGELHVYDGLDWTGSFKTLELPWMENTTNVSSIPKGKYLVCKRWSEAHKDHLIIQGVNGRYLILIHAANFVRQLRGCIAIGYKYIDIDSDGELDVASSRSALDGLLNYMNELEVEEFELQII